MKNPISIFLLVIYLFSATECSQLLKLPVLILHFQEHQQKNASISFVQFIYHHYAINHTDDGDAEKDKQLPFQSHDNFSSFQAPINLFPTLTPLPPRVAVLQEIKPSFYNSTYILAAYLDSIWQPPRLA
jgi:hypothetical protein